MLHIFSLTLDTVNKCPTIYSNRIYCVQTYRLLVFTECEELYFDDWFVLSVCLTTYLSSLIFIGTSRFFNIRGNKCAVVTLSYVPPPQKERLKPGLCFFFQNQNFATCNQSQFELLHTWHSSQCWSHCLMLTKNVWMCTVCRVCSGLRHCEHTITIYVHIYVLICICEYVIWDWCSCIEGDGKRKVGILIRSLFTWLTIKIPRGVLWGPLLVCS